MQPVKAPWIRPGVVVHDPAEDVDALLAEFARTLVSRGFRVAGFVHLDRRRPGEPGEGCGQRLALLDLARGVTIPVDDTRDGSFSPAALGTLRESLREDVDLVVVGRFPAFAAAARPLTTAVGDAIARGLPVLTSVAGRCLEKWYRLVGEGGVLLSPAAPALWNWWGAERIYRDLALGVADVPIRRIVCGPRWLMVEGPDGVGLAQLPKSPAALQPRLPSLRGMSLRALAGLTESWDGLEMAVGVAAINAHYNRFDLDLPFGNGARAFCGVQGRTTVIGAFPGLAQTLPGAQVIEPQPRPGELPSIAIDTVLPGAEAVVVTATSVGNRTLPRVLRLAAGARVALVGPSAPMTPRLHAYGIEVIGGLRVRDADGIADAVKAGMRPRDFERHGDFVHLREVVRGPRERCVIGTAPDAEAAGLPMSDGRVTQAC